MRSGLRRTGDDLTWPLLPSLALAAHSHPVAFCVVIRFFLSPFYHLYRPACPPLLPRSCLQINVNCQLVLSQEMAEEKEILSRGGGVLIGGMFPTEDSHSFSCLCPRFTEMGFYNRNDDSKL